LARALGIGQLVVAVNKMDHESINWSKERFDFIVHEIGSFLKLCGFYKPLYVPCSGLSGENLIISNSTELNKWYSGPTLIQRIDEFKPPERLLDKPARFCVSDVFKSTSLGQAVAGKLESGTICVSDNVLVLPANETCQIKSIEKAEQTVKWASAGDNIEIGLIGFSNDASISIGDMICHPEHPVPVVTHFTAQIIVFANAPTIPQGSQVMLFSQSIKVPAVIYKFIHLADRNTGEVTKKKSKKISCWFYCIS